jgi:P4 family phage/plasmid primase-like protien
MSERSLPRGEQPTFRVSVCKHYDASRPKAENSYRVASGWEVQDVTWADEAVTRLVTESGISPNFYASGNRLNDNWQGIESIMLDFDDGSNSTLDLEIYQDVSPFCSYLFSSQNHMKEKSGKPACERLRLFIPLNRPIYDPRELEKLKECLLDEIGDFDTSCFDLGRYFAHGTIAVSRFITEKGFYPVDERLRTFAKESAQQFRKERPRASVDEALDLTSLHNIELPEREDYPARVVEHIGEHPDRKLARTLTGKRTEKKFSNLLEDGDTTPDRSQYDIATASLCFLIGCTPEETLQTMLASPHGKAMEAWTSSNRDYVLHKIEDGYLTSLARSEEQEVLGDSAPDLATRFLEKHYPRLDGFPTFLIWNDRLYRFIGTQWKELKESELNSQINTFLRSTNVKEKAGTPFQGYVKRNVLDPSRISEEIQLGDWFDGEERGLQINLLSGQLSIAEFLYGLPYPIHRHTPNFFTTTCLPFSFNERANCSRWMQFLDEVAPDPEIQRMLQQMMGLFLVPDTDFHSFWILVGPGANGKSKVCEVLSALLGEENVSNVSLDQMSEKHTPIAMLGKLANIASEIETDEIRTGERIIKAITGGDPITLNEKFKTPFQAKLSARLLFACNELPIFKDRSQAIKRRLVIIPMTQEIPLEKRDPRLFEKLQKELPGILNWALIGLKDLYGTMELFEAKTSRRVKKDHLKLSNPWEEWIRDHLQFDGTFKTSLPCLEVFQSFQNHFRARGSRKVLTDATFGRALSHVFPEVTKTRIRVNGERKYHYAGLKWIDGDPPVREETPMGF